MESAFLTGIPKKLKFSKNSDLIYTFILLRNSSRRMIRILLGKAVDFAKQMVNLTGDRRALMRKSLLRITRVSSCSADLLPTTIMDNQFSLFSSYLLWAAHYMISQISNPEFRLPHVYFNQSKVRFMNQTITRPCWLFVELLQFIFSKRRWLFERFMKKRNLRKGTEQLTLLYAPNSNIFFAWMLRW